MEQVGAVSQSVPVGSDRQFCIRASTLILADTRGWFFSPPPPPGAGLSAHQHLCECFRGLENLVTFCSRPESCFSPHRLSSNIAVDPKMVKKLFKNPVYSYIFFVLILLLDPAIRWFNTNHEL